MALGYAHTMRCSLFLLCVFLNLLTLRGCVRACGVVSFSALNECVDYREE